MCDILLASLLRLELSVMVMMRRRGENLLKERKLVKERKEYGKG